MNVNVLLDFNDYKTLRHETRQALHFLNIASNPGFSDQNIIDGLAGALNIPSPYPEELSHPEFSGEIFRDSLGVILGLDLPPQVEDVIHKLHSVTE